MLRRKTSAFLFISLAMALLACRTITGVTPAAITPQPAPSPTPASAPLIEAPPAVDLISSQDTLVHLYEVATPGVVSVRVLTQGGGGLGSGFVYDQSGVIVTNYHVVDQEDQVEVAFHSGLKVSGQVIARDLDSDLALVRVDAPSEELHPLPLGDSDQLKVGQAVAAIGNPFGLQGTMTLGIISGIGRTIQSLHTTPEGGVFSAGDIIQTDAAINPGNSGGPLLNLSGEVIGVNESIISGAGGQGVNSGVSFAVSVNVVKRVIPALLSQGKYDYPYLGLTSWQNPLTNDLTLVEQKELGLPRTTGIYVTEVTPGSPAERAGIRGGSRKTGIPGLLAGGDLIVAVDGRELLTFDELISYLVKTKSPGDRIVLTVLRDDQEIDLDLVLDKRPIP